MNGSIVKIDICVFSDLETIADKIVVFRCFYHSNFKHVVSQIIPTFWKVKTFHERLSVCVLVFYLLSNLLLWVQAQVYDLQMGILHLIVK